MSLKASFILLVLSLFAAPALLSAQAVAPGHRSVPNAELYAGFSHVFKSYDETSLNNFSGGMNGWDASLKLPVPFFGSWLGAKGEVSGTYRSDQPDFNPHSYFFLLGPQISTHVGRSTIFLHGLVGSAHLNDQAIPNLKSNNTFAIAVGGGFDVGLSRNWAWRIQGDFYNTNYQSTNANVHQIVNSNGRLSTGLVLRF
jgi:opacity protein-like surface antigen